MTKLLNNESACLTVPGQVADDGTDYDYSVQHDYGSVSNYSTLRTATRYCHNTT
jgi:hypothetical protein